MDSKGRTLYYYHKKLYQDKKVISEELANPPEIDKAFLHIKDWFLALSRARFNYTGMSFQYAPLQFSEIKAYFDIMKIDAHRAEVEALWLLDSVFLAVMNEREKENV